MWTLLTDGLVHKFKIAFWSGLCCFLFNEYNQNINYPEKRESVGKKERVGVNDLAFRVGQIEVVVD